MNRRNGYLYLTFFRKCARSFSTKTITNLKTKQPIQTNTDIIGPPDPISNLRPIIFAKRKKETDLEKKYRESREATQLWNQRFWANHNFNFTMERKRFKEARENEGENSLTADEMSVFYKQFLDKHWQTHLDYNITWYRKNIGLLFLEIRVKLSKLKFK